MKKRKLAKKLSQLIDRRFELEGETVSITGFSIDKPLFTLYTKDEDITCIIVDAEDFMEKLEDNELTSVKPPALRSEVLPEPISVRRDHRKERGFSPGIKIVAIGYVMEESMAEGNEGALPIKHQLGRIMEACYKYNNAPASLYMFSIDLAANTNCLRLYASLKEDYGVWLWRISSFLFPQPWVSFDETLRLLQICLRRIAHTAKLPATTTKRRIRA